MKQTLIFVFLVAVLMISGCSAQKTQPSVAPSGDLGIKTDVAISNYAFNPSTLTVPEGTSVVWTNSDSAPHTIVSGSEILSSSISQGQTYVYTFNTPGTYEYYCGIHPSMKGTIIVE